MSNTEVNSVRFNRLPKWAQGIIAQQQREIDRLHKDLKALTKPDPDSEMLFDSWHGEVGTQIEIPKGKLTVNLGTDKHGRRHELNIRVEQDLHGHKAVRIEAYYGPLTITPASTNVVTITSLRNGD